jgi:hypothetical protein
VRRGERRSERVVGRGERGGVRGNEGSEEMRRGGVRGNDGTVPAHSSSTK